MPPILRPHFGARLRGAPLFIQTRIVNISCVSPWLVDSAPESARNPARGVNILQSRDRMGDLRNGRSREDAGRLSAVDPASRPLVWKARAFEAAARLAGALETCRDHREAAAEMLRAVAGGLCVGRHALYLDEKGNGHLELMHGGTVDPGTLPRTIDAGSTFVDWLGRSGSPEVMESFFCSPGELTGSELDAQDAFVRAGTGSACALKFCGEVIGLYVFSSDLPKGCPAEDMRLAIGLMAGITSVAVAGRLISDDSGRGAEALEKKRDMEFRAVRNAVLEKTAADLETSLGVLKSGLWSMDPGDDSGHVMIDMARDAAVRLGARIRELISLSGIEPDGPLSGLTEVDMADVIEDVTREMIADFERRELTVSVEDRSGGMTIRADRGKLEYVVRSIVEKITLSVGRGSAVEIVWSVVSEGPGGEDGPWLVLRVSGGEESGGDAIDAILDSLAAEYKGSPGPPADSGLTLSGYILESLGGRLFAGDDDPGAVSAWLPLGY
jgi:hypothetical protein